MCCRRAVCLCWFCSYSSFFLGKTNIWMEGGFGSLSCGCATFACAGPRPQGELRRGSFAGNHQTRRHLLLRQSRWSSIPYSVNAATLHTQPGYFACSGGTRSSELCCRQQHRVVHREFPIAKARVVYIFRYCGGCGVILGASTRRRDSPRISEHNRMTVSNVGRFRL